MAQEILTSWKEIASYLGKGVRTVQRWEAELSLPVRRPGPDRHIVVAFAAEIDAWARGQQVSVEPETKESRPQPVAIPGNGESKTGEPQQNLGNEMLRQHVALNELRKLRALMLTMMERVEMNRKKTTVLLSQCERYSSRRQSA